MKLNKAKPFVFYPGGNPVLLTKAARAAKLWRPTVVGFFKNEGQFFGIEQWRFRKNKEDPCIGLELRASFPKGGVDDGEDPEAALLRETEEEASTCPLNFMNIRFIGFVLVEYGKRDRVRDGFTRGKLWLVYTGDVRKRGCIHPNNNHAVERILWVDDPRDLLQTHENKTNKKREAFSSPAFLELIGIRP